MTDAWTVLYLGEPSDLDSVLPTDEAVLGQVTRSAETASRRLRADEIDCLVIDTRLPDLSVTTVLEAASVPVVLVATDEAAVDSDRPAAVVAASAPAEVRRDAVSNVLSGEPTDRQRCGFARDVLAVSPVGILVVDDGEITRTNRQAETLLEITPAGGSDRTVEQVSGRLFDESGEPFTPTEFPFRQVLSTGDSVLGYASEDATDDAPQRWLLVNGEPLPGPESRAVLTCKDVTWLKEQQRELERQQTELDEAVTELRRSNAELEQFAYVASHDLREPLRMVSNYLGLLERRYGDELDDDAGDFIEYAVEGAQRMRRFINDLLEYSRIGRDDGEPMAVDLETVVESVRRNLEVRLEESDAEVIVGVLPTVRGNDHRLEQLLQNLLSNAITYAGEQPPHIEIDATRSGDMWELTVADSGVGIDEEGRERAFDLFYTTSDDEGTGIGLALCRKIARSHGGDIWLDSTPEQGTTIHVTLPDAEQSVPEADFEASTVPTSPE